MYPLRTRFWLVLGGLFAAAAQLSSVHAQGSLTPPGAPAPSMKSLDQIEPRTPISAAPFLISQPGSYYLTTNVFVSAGAAIAILTNDVVLDLNGFTVRGGTGIYGAYALTNVTIRNGLVKNCTGGGLSLGSVQFCHVENLTVSGNGGIGAQVADRADLRHCVLVNNTSTGINAGVGATVQDCNSSSNGLNGIQVGANSLVARCLVESNLTYGILTAAYTRIEGCRCLQNHSYGVSALNGCAVVDCVATGNVTVGISAGGDSQVAGCQAIQNIGDGIDTAGNCNLVNCLLQENTANGVGAGLNNRVQDCHAVGNFGTGIFVGDRSQVVNCQASGNGSRGVFANHNCLVSGCLADQNAYSGIYLGWPGSLVVNNNCAGNNTTGSSLEAGILVDDSNNRVEGNHVTASGYAGIQIIASYVNNVITRNSVSGNAGNNYITPSGNDIGPISTAAAATSPWANISH